MKKKTDWFVIEFPYAIGLSIGLLMGAWAGWSVIGAVVFIWFIILIQRLFKF